MGILNYFFVGTVFTFMIDCILKWQKDHPKVSTIFENNNWENRTRITYILLWPLALLVFFIAFIKSFIK
jgi:hypothetical protein